jgi:DNA mitochondrial polymerase exonuclease domain
MLNLPIFDPYDWSTVVSIVNACERAVPQIPTEPLTLDEHGANCWHLWDNRAKIWQKADRDAMRASVYCLDVETSVKNRYLALASMYDVLTQNWYAWLQAPDTDEHLSVPDGSLIIAHRSSFEASFIKECYTLETKTRFLDTHTMAAVQIHPTDEALCRAKPHLPMFREASPLGLADLYKWATRQEMDKSSVDIFIKSTKISFYDHLAEGFQYNYTDVRATIMVFWKLWDNYVKMPEAFVSGLLERSIPLMTLAPDWYEAVERIDKCYEQHNAEIQSNIDSMVNERIASPDYDGVDDLDCRLWGKTAKNDKAGMPKWWDKTKITVGSSTIAILSQLTWNRKPIVRQTLDLPELKKDGTPKQSKKFYTVDPSDMGHLDAITTAANMAYLDNPNNTGKEPKAIAGFFGKNFLPFWENDILSGKPQAVEIAKLFVKTTFWRSIRSRVFGMLIREMSYGLASVPLTATAGTITNRAIDKLWLVLAKLDPDKIGSELMGQVKAPKGYKLVYADFDSVQAVIAAAIADMFTAKENGQRTVTMCSNEFSRSCLLGNKADRSTLAYKIADSAGIDYGKGKNAQYAMLFWVGIAKLGVMVNDLRLGAEIVNRFRGKREGSKYVGGLASAYFNGAVELANGMYSIGGRWSRSPRISTIFSGRELSASISPGVRLENYGTTAYNAVVQGVDVDFLCHITWLVGKKLRDAGIAARFCYTIHDALFYYVEENRATEAAEIFQQAHTEVYLAFLKAINADVATFPEHLLRFSGVDIEDRIRKDKKDDGKTLSNPDGYYVEDVDNDPDKADIPVD